MNSLSSLFELTGTYGGSGGLEKCSCGFPKVILGPRLTYCRDCGPRLLDPHLVSTRPALTGRQREVYEFIVGFVKSSNGASPTLREIRDALGLNSVATVHAHLKEIEIKGYIVRKHGGTRSISVVDEDNVKSLILKLRREKAELVFRLNRALAERDTYRKLVPSAVLEAWDERQRRRLDQDRGGSAQC